MTLLALGLVLFHKQSLEDNLMAIGMLAVWGVLFSCVVPPKISAWNWHIVTAIHTHWPQPVTMPNSDIHTYWPHPATWPNSESMR